jgi:hypothetical protein
MKSVQNKFFVHLILHLFILCPLFGQQHLSIKGTITDAQTGEALAFATVVYIGNESVGTTTDFDGIYNLESKWGTDSIQASYIGYKPISVAIEKGVKKQIINFKLEKEGFLLVTAEVKAKKQRYRRKNNPAVALIKKVIANKSKNRMQSQEFFEYHKYEKMELALNNITDKFRKKKSFKKFQFLFDYVDTSAMNGKPYLPIYIRETASEVYYRKNPSHEKEYRNGIKVTEFDKWINTDNMSLLTERLYQKIDIYEDNIFMMSKSFISPLSDFAGNAFYRYYILDTIQYKGMEVIDLAFMPANKQDIGFKGNLYILNDSTHAVVKASLGITQEANINWVNELLLIQEFEHQDSFWILSRDEITIDFALTKKSNGLFGKRTVMYDNHLFNVERAPAVYKGVVDIIDADNVYRQKDDFWKKARQEPLSKREENIYVMVDSLQKVPAFKRTMNILSTLFTGYWNFDKVNMGPVGAFYSFNEVEGFRLRFGGATNLFFNPKMQLEGYAAYGFKDKKFKYGASLLYSLRGDYNKYPLHNFKLSYQKETNFVGQKLDFVVEDNFLLSFKRGNASKMLFLETYLAAYLYETNQDLAFSFQFKNQSQTPLGSLRFNYFPENEPNNIASLNQVKISELSTKIRWAPNQQFVQGQNYRVPIYNRSPIFTLEYKYGAKGLLGSQYAYHKLYIDVFKRFYLPFIGMTNVVVEGGKIWSKGIPYYLLFIPRANQTFSYKHRSYNLMNYLEFASDSYFSWNIEHFFNGFIFNKIPLLKHLKLREVITFKGVWGQLSDQNNPNINKGLIQFIENENGQQETSSLQGKPYMEASIGVLNIFKVGRIDLVKRLNYLDAPNLPILFGTKGLGIRFMLRFEF